MKKILIIIVCCLMPITALAEIGKVKVDGVNDWLNIRKEPSEYSKVIGMLENGTEIEYAIVETSSAYLAVKSGKTTIGYVASMYIQRPSVIDEIYKYKKYTVLTDVSMTDDCVGDVCIVGSLKKGELVEGIVENINFIHVVGGGFVPKLALKEIDGE